MTSLAETLSDGLRAWIARGQSPTPAPDAATHAEAQAHLAERRAEMCHWLFLVRAGLALGLAAYLAVSALATAQAWPIPALLLAAGYVVANAAARCSGERWGQGAPWAYAFIDFGLVLLLCGFFGSALGPILSPGVQLVGLLVMLLLVYTLLGNPALNAVLSLAALGTVGSVFYLVPSLARAARPLAGSSSALPLRAFLLVEYLSIACLVTCLVALRLRRRLVAHSTELHRRLKATLEATLEEDRRRHLEAVGQLKRDFIMVLSHELRNPVAPLVSSLEVVQDDAAHGRCDADLVGIAVDSAVELQQLVDDYTQLAELLTRPLEDAARWNVPLAPLATATAARLTERIIDHGSRVFQPQFAFEELDERAVASDPALLHDTMHALLRRAAHHTPDGQIITVRGLEERGDVGFAVHDPATHLDDQTLAALDDLFAPSEERLYSESTTGLELLLARHALRRVGGRLRAESSPEHGTTIYCLLPAASPEHAWAEEKDLLSFTSSPHAHAR